ncbi:hypothetical protein ACHAW6_009173 [Cyclotella cf. meneghiniana]
MTTRCQSFCRKCHSSSSVRHANNTQKQTTSYWSQRQSRLIQNSFATAQRTMVTNFTTLQGKKIQMSTEKYTMSEKLCSLTKTGRFPKQS